MRSRCGFDHQAQKQAEADAKEVPNGGLWMRMDEDVVWGEESRAPANHIFTG